MPFPGFTASPRQPTVIDVYHKALSMLEIQEERQNAETGRRADKWRRQMQLWQNRPTWWREKYIAHNKAMAEKGIGSAVELVAMATKVQMKR
jgi:hypothetical protein